MTQEDKDLLIKDLSERLPYGIWFQSYHSEGGIEGKGTFNYYVDLETKHAATNITNVLPNCKPFLRSMSSMTRKEIEEGSQLIQDYEDEYSGFEYLNLHDGYKYFDWLNAHHFDYRGLIPMGLALEAPKDMYKFN